MIIAELAMEAGLPDGVFNIVHGTHVRCLTIITMSLFVNMPHLSTDFLGLDTLTWPKLCYSDIITWTSFFLLKMQNF